MLLAIRGTKQKIRYAQASHKDLCQISRQALRAEEGVTFASVKVAQLCGWAILGNHPSMRFGVQLFGVLYPQQ